MIDSNDIVARPGPLHRQGQGPGAARPVLAVSKRLEKDPAYEFSPRLWVEFAAALPLLVQPDTAYHYSNIGYIVAGLVASAQAGRAFRPCSGGRSSRRCT